MDSKQISTLQTRILQAHDAGTINTYTRELLLVRARRVDELRAKPSPSEFDRLTADETEQVISRLLRDMETK